MFSCNNNRHVFCDQTFWIIVVIAIIILWAYYSCHDFGCNTCADNCNPCY